MASLRLWHSYLSVFVAPSVIFFSLTGALQIFNLHESHEGYEPSPLIEKLSHVHKEQVFLQEQAQEQSNEHTEEHRHDERSSPMRLPTFVLKCFFLSSALLLATTTCLGLWIALARLTRRRTTYLLLSAGTLIPIILIIL